MRPSYFVQLILTFAVLAFTGCTLPVSTTAAGTESIRISGKVHGGQQPVVGSTIQLYAVGTAADGSAARALLTQSVVTLSDGSFDITGDYSCANATEVYLVATGGNPGLGSNNPNLAMMAAPGLCSSLTANTFVTINELTTVAATSALYPYMSSFTSIGSGDSEAMSNAFAFAAELVNPSTGMTPGIGIPSGLSVPSTELNTLADILAACINSTGGTAGSSTACGSLFSLQRSVDRLRPATPSQRC